MRQLKSKTKQFFKVMQQELRFVLPVPTEKNLAKTFAQQYAADAKRYGFR